MKEHYVNSLNNFISGWYMDSTDVCDEIIEFHKTNIDKASPGKIGGVIKLEVKDSLDLILDMNPTLYVKYCNHLKDVLDLYSEKYKFVQESDIFENYEAINVQFYPPGGGFKTWHTERDNGYFPFRNRYLAFMTYLNDVDDNGETEFYYQGIKIKAEKGLTLMWGVDWTFTHRGITSMSQEKYITTGWFSFKDKEKQ